MPKSCTSLRVPSPNGKLVVGSRLLIGSLSERGRTDMDDHSFAGAMSIKTPGDPVLMQSWISGVLSYWKICCSSRHSFSPRYWLPSISRIRQSGSTAFAVGHVSWTFRLTGDVQAALTYSTILNVVALHLI